MPHSPQRKQRTRQKILRSACRLFTSQGFDATSIEEIMRACNLTRGGFYAHFKSKSHLYRQAIDESAGKRELAAAHDHDADSWLDSLLDEYLRGDSSHFTFLAADIASRDPEVRAAYGSAFKSMSDAIYHRVAENLPCGEASILSLASMIIGARAIAQTLDDPTLQAKVLDSCRQNAKALLETSNEYAAPSFFWTPTLEN